MLISCVAWLASIERDREIILCRITQLGFLRILNNPVAMGEDAQNGHEAWQTWDTLRADARFRFSDEPENFDATLRSLTNTFTHQPKRWQDASLAAFAIAAEAELVSFDSGLRAFPGLRPCILSPKTQKC